MNNLMTQLNFSPAELGAICYALENTYSSDSEEIMCIEKNICEAMYNHLGAEFYDMWVQEFDLSAFQ